MICGGLNLSNSEITNACFFFDGERMCLERKADMLVKRVGHAVCYLDDYVYAVGGKTNDMVCSKLCERYSINDNKWEPISNLNYGRSMAGITTFKDSNAKDHIYTFFGNDSI